ncbi:MAG TPA: FAD-dependent oxidoreductase [bacterium]|nr:FAD-dependent oxidoreductase [bacterium]
MQVDVAIIGAGPAGLAAAAAAAEHGLNTIILDEGLEPGGRLLSQVHEISEAGRAGHVWNGPRVAADLAAAAKNAGAQFCLRSTVWGLFPGWRIMLHGPGPAEIEAARLIVATGAMQLPVALPGWTLPGVMTVGAAQSMINHHRVLPGRRAVLIGIDLLALTVAQQLTSVGVEVAGVVMPAPGPLTGPPADLGRVVDELLRLGAWAPAAGLRLAGCVLQGFAASHLVARLFPPDGVRVWDIAVMPRRAALEIRGNGSVKSVILADLTPAGEPDLETAREVEVDLVCTSGGLAPLTELPEIAGCRISYVAEWDASVPLHGPALETTAEGVFVAGSVTGVEGAPIAALQGRLAGYAVASAAGRMPRGEYDAELQRVQKELNDIRRHAIPLWRNIAAGRAAIAGSWQEARRGAQA